jgi:hypothetical protein
VNAARAIEMAFADVFRTYAELGASCVVRAWQSLPSDPIWSALSADKKDRSFPLVDVRCGSPRFDANQRTMYCEAQILCATKTDDDVDHSKIQSLYGEVQKSCDALYAQFISGADSEELTAFKQVLTDELGAHFHFGGFTFGEGMAPTDSDGANMIGIAVQTHFSRSDF